jgi:hypothetical protein
VVSDPQAAEAKDRCFWRLCNFIVRGIGCSGVYLRDADVEGFLKRLGDILMEAKTTRNDWALMSNYFL